MMKRETLTVVVEKAKVTLDLNDLLKRKKSLRKIGEDIRLMIKSAWTDSDIVQLDFGNETVASGSIFDEIAKLFDEFPKEEVKRRLQFKDIDPWDLKLLAHLSKLRLDKQKEKIKP
ncbi:MAG: STAS-like domain-containing protein [Calditrichaeota bacterium]|nr:STAS-like domain-containing protein [Calditrichota bacterium]